MAQPIDAMQIYQGYQTADSQNALRGQSMRESAAMHPLQVQQLQLNMLAKRRQMEDEERQRNAMQVYQQTGNLNALAAADPKIALQMNQMQARERMNSERLNALANRQGRLGGSSGARGSVKPIWDAKRGQFIIPPSPENPTGGVISPAGVAAVEKEDKPLTEAQGNATGFGLRASKAADLIDDLEATGTFGRQANVVSGTRTALDRIPVIGTAAANLVGGAGNMLVTAPQQRYEQARGDFIRAVLRKESGATITGEETDAATRQYFPVMGDSDDVIKQKALNRRTALESLKIQAGPGAKNIPAAKQRGEVAAPSGVDPKIWAVMTPEERKLWQK